MDTEKNPSNSECHHRQNPSESACEFVCSEIHFPSAKGENIKYTYVLMLYVKELKAV
jgi:hypothetical protein